MDFGQGLGFDNDELQGLGFQINHLSTQINPIDTIPYNLESGQQNLSDGQIEFRVQDLKDGFRQGLGFENMIWMSISRIWQNQHFDNKIERWIAWFH